VTGEALLPPPALGALRAAALGREDATADLLWLRTVQFIGAPYSERLQYKGLEQWIERITMLAPTFALPYLTGGILLATSPGRADAADALVARAEEQMPNNLEFPQTRGFIAYFGKLDPARAAQHYRRAASLPRAPPYFAKLADRLERESTTCSAMRANLNDVIRASSPQEAERMKQEGARIMINCSRAQLNLAAVSFHLDNPTGEYAKSVDELLETGRLAEPPYTPPGQCWVLERDRAKLKDCP
jgi:hypothetical protein